MTSKGKHTGEPCSGDRISGFFDLLPENLKHKGLSDSFCSAMNTLFIYIRAI